jgi:hypothetical protein
MSIEEVDWYSTIDGRLRGVIPLDRQDGDSGWVVFARVDRIRYVGID